MLDEKFLDKDERPLVKELQAAGFKVHSAWDFVNTSKGYVDAIPILIRHLSKPYHPRNKEGIVRALAVREAKGIACKALLEEYLKASKDDFHYRWTFGNTMERVITKEYISEVLEIVKNPDNGDSRHMFIRALGKLKAQDAKKTLEKLVKGDSEVIAKEAEKALKKIG